MQSREPVSATSASRAWLLELAWTLPFLILYWLDIAHHVLWRDEINAWGIVVNSATLTTLARYVHYEAHPWLWYVVLWVPSRITAAPVAMKWVEACIGTAIYLLIGLKSPFTRTEKSLIFLGYFIAFEYTVMSRMYGIMLLMALLYAWRRVEKPNGVIGLAVILGLMASTDMSGVLLSGALLLEYVSTRWYDRDRGSAADASATRQIAAALVYCGLLALSIYSLLPAADISWRPAGGKLFSEAGSLKHITRCVVNLTAAPWWPISRYFPHKFWETDARVFHNLQFLAPLILLAYWHTFRRQRGALLLLGLTLGFGVLFADFVYVGHVRHWGITVLAFLVALWMLRAKLNRTAPSRATPRLPYSAYALLGLSALAGVLATASSWARPFSQSANVAAWLRANHLADAALVGNEDVSFSAVAEQLQRPVYFMECACVDRIKLFSHGREMLLDGELPGKLVEAQRNLKTNELILLADRPLERSDTQGLTEHALRAAPLAIFSGAEAELENFYIYRITASGTE